WTRCCTAGAAWRTTGRWTRKPTKSGNEHPGRDPAGPRAGRIVIVVFGYLIEQAGPGSNLGLQFPATLADGRVWRETHLRAGRRLSWLGVAVIVGGFALLFTPISDVIALALHVGLSVVVLVWILWDASRFANARL